METGLTVEQSEVIRKNIEFNKTKLEVSAKQFVPSEEIYLIYKELGTLYYLSGHLVESKEAFKSAVRLNPRDPTLWAAFFSVYKDMYDYKNALVAVKKSLELNPVDWNLWRGRIELERFQFHASRDDLDKLYKEALETTENDINIITVYALFLEEGGNIKEALHYWNLAVKNSTENHLFKEEIRRLERFKE